MGRVPKNDLWRQSKKVKTFSYKAERLCDISSHAINWSCRYNDKASSISRQTRIGHGQRSVTCVTVKCHSCDSILTNVLNAASQIFVQLNPNYDVINDVISGFAKAVVERCGFHHWIAQRISWGEVVSVFLYLLQFPSYDVINDVIMSDADCTPGREPRSVAASLFYLICQWAGQQLLQGGLVVQWLARWTCNSIIASSILDRCSQYWIGDRLRAGNHLSISPSHQANSASYPQRLGK